MLKLGFIGAGIVGTALAHRLDARGYPIVAVSSRTKVSAMKLTQSIKGCQVCDDSQGVADKAELVFITTPDAAIGIVANQTQWHPGQSVVHCSGADSTDVLVHARRCGGQVGAFHPLQTFAGVKQAIENIPGSTFSIEAEEPLLGILKDLAVALDGRWVELDASDKVLYHASAVMTSNYLVTLVKMATELWQTFGISQKDATQALLPLLKGTISNIENIGLPNCLTGPIARGDTGTVKKHLDAMERMAPDLLSAYRELGRQTIPIALAKGRINELQAQELEAVLHQPVSPRNR